MALSHVGHTSAVRSGLADATAAVLVTEVHEAR